MTVEIFLEAFAAKLRESQILPEGVSLRSNEVGGLSGFQEARGLGPPSTHVWNTNHGLRKRPPLVYISWLAHTKMWFYTMRCPVEIRWMLSCYEFVCENIPIILVADAMLPEQDCSGGAVRVSAAQYGLFLSAFSDDPRTEHIPDTLWGSGHSHHYMSAYTSGDDANEIIKALKYEERYLLRVICNKYNELHCTIADATSGDVFEGVTWVAENIWPTDDLCHELELQFQRRVTIVERGVTLIPYPLVVSEPVLQGEVS